MANEISIRINYTFLSDNGTSYNRDHTYVSDALTTSSRPKRYMLGVEVNSLPGILYGDPDNYRTQLPGASLLWLVNRDNRVNMTAQVLTSGLTYIRTIKPGEWLFLDVAEGCASAIGGGGAFTYGAEPMTVVNVATEFQAAAAELLSIYKAAS